MSSVPVFEAWSASAIEQRVLEAAETLMLSPRARGPKAFGTSMPGPVRDPRDAYAAGSTRYQRLPQAAAIDRMEQCWGWINALPERRDRQLLYDWARTKCTRGRSLAAFARSRDVSARSLRREVMRICQAIADRLNREARPRLDGEPVVASPRPKKNQSEKRYDKYWRAVDAKPQIDPTVAKSRILPR